MTMPNVIHCIWCNKETGTTREFQLGSELACPFCGKPLQIRHVETQRVIRKIYTGYPKDAL